LLRAVWAVHACGSEVVLESPLHEISGLITFSCACLCLVALNARLRPDEKGAKA
jgi:hypothetical protein